MTDDRIPIWNDIFIRILVATSEINCCKIEINGKVQSFKLFAPWKKNKNCVLIMDNLEEKYWKIDVLSDQELKERYPMTYWVPEKKTARSKLSRDELYLICTLWNIDVLKIKDVTKFDLAVSRLRSVTSPLFRIFLPSFTEV